MLIFPPLITEPTAKEKTSFVYPSVSLIASTFNRLDFHFFFCQLTKSFQIICSLPWKHEQPLPYSNEVTHFEAEQSYYLARLDGGCNLESFLKITIEVMLNFCILFLLHETNYSFYEYFNAKTKFTYFKNHKWQQ